MARRLVLIAVAASALGVSAPSATARCSHPVDLVCTVNCTVARLAGALCKA